MDYCIPCNRTLNGAVTCPECGAYDSGAAEAADRGDSAAATAATLPDTRFGVEPAPQEALEILESPTAPRGERPRKLKRYAGRALAAAAFTVLGGVAAATLLPQQTTPRAAPAPDQPLPDESRVQVTDAPAAPSPTATHGTREAHRGRVAGRSARPGPTASRRQPAAVRTPTATAVSRPPATADPTPRRPSGRPSPTAQTGTPTARPSASPSGTAGASPSASASPSMETIERPPRLTPG
ncbi:hypothetical protein [Streptomyces bungoensis]|uniref:hypothetical protein n=1 Tax=Streptomyces bungoensis TaxID=285568 RepID=UPI003427A145